MTYTKNVKNKLHILVINKLIVEYESNLHITILQVATLQEFSIICLRLFDSH